MIAPTLLALALAGCGGGSEEQGSQSENGDTLPEEQASAREEAASKEAVVGELAIEGSSEREISMLETTVEREDVENYLHGVRQCNTDAFFGIPASAGLDLRVVAPRTIEVIPRGQRRPGSACHPSWRNRSTPGAERRPLARFLLGSGWLASSPETTVR